MISAQRSSRRSRSRWGLLAAGVLVAGALFSLAAIYLYLRSTHQPSTRSGPVGSLSTEQSQLLLQELAKHPTHSLTIKADPADHESTQFAQQLLGALRSAQWQADLSTAQSGPAIGPGLCVAQTGEDARPAYSALAQDPYFYLRDALDAAHIDVSCQSGQSSGDYKLYLVIGHPEQAQSAAVRHGFILRAAERWVLRHLKALRGA